MNKSKIHANNRDDWETPREFFDLVSEMVGGFNLDAAASAENALCGMYYDIQDDALSQAWADITWCNPPYSRKSEFISHAIQQGIRLNPRS